MRYVGSKNKIGKDIVKIMTKDRGDKTFVDIFCGGCNVSKFVQTNLILNDSNKYLVAMLDGLVNKTQEPFYGFSKEDFKEARKIAQGKPAERNYNDFQVGWIALTASFNARFFGAYSADYKGQDMIASRARSILRTVSCLKDVKAIYNLDYKEVPLPPSSIIYCDPPYVDFKDYYAKSVFSHTEFYDWCRQKAKEGHTVYVSELSAPDDFEVVWEKPIKHTFISKGKSVVEKLFKVSGHEIDKC